jgi:16S rRNA (uracil1498-N3)-methyltransferase
MQFFFGQYNLYDKSVQLDPVEQKHCLKVLRKKTGDLIQVTDGTGKIYETRIVDDNWKNPVFTCEEIKEVEERKYALSIAIALTKNLQRVEWFLEKSTEIGIDSIYFIESSRSEKAKFKKERFENILRSAAKQSGNLKLPKMYELQSFEDYIEKPFFEKEQKFIAYCEDKPEAHLFSQLEKGISASVLIGPEGDFTSEEVQLAEGKGFNRISLGNSRLRTETAGIVACEIVNLANL